ncbi:hypothetical protein Hanom_Chr15g01342411 [Helianthus anomalus]
MAFHMTLQLTRIYIQILHIYTRVLFSFTWIYDCNLAYTNKSHYYGFLFYILPSIEEKRVHQQV